MIRSLSGTVEQVDPASLVVSVQGVGYLVAVRNGGDYTLNDEVTLWTYLAVRETALDLYGFATRDELEIFELLLTLPKVGPKSAMQILAQADIELLKQAVANDDASYLSKMSGIGKKTAEKIVHELKDKFADLGAVGADASAVVPTTSHHADAIDALISLGYPERDARKAVQNLPAEVATTNEAVRTALKVLSN
ncbi:MAG: Holliday junction branch migration protein RuvA [Patescibacteria group bacterium]